MDKDNDLTGLTADGGCHTETLIFFKPSHEINGSIYSGARTAFRVGRAWQGTMHISRSGLSWHRSCMTAHHFFL
jgi:hypothetical protein